MKLVVDADQMSAIDKYTIEKVGIPSMVLMEKAAMKVLSLMLEKIEKSDKILAVCGTGNNGGDGVACARMLHELGYQAKVLVIGDEKRASEQMKQQLVIARKLGLTILNTAKISEYNVIIDAIFGIGLKKPVQGAFAEVVEEVNVSGATVFSVDVPSGVSANNGKILGIAIRAHYTVTFGYYKMGLIMYPGCEYAGKVVLADIGFPKNCVLPVSVKSFLYEQDDLKLLPKRSNYSNKGTYGRVLIIAGSKNMSGACFFSAKAAYRMGAGLVKVLTVEDNRSIMQTQLPEALLVTYDPMNLKNILEIERLIHEIKWASSIVIGPGLGVTGSSDKLLDLVLQHAEVPVVIDADGLNLLSNKEEFVVKVDETNDIGSIKLPDNVVITPHLKEMSTLTNLPVKYISEEILGVSRKYVKENSYVLALKDARTVVTDGERTYINVSGNHGMATGGSGDVLTGIIAALLAQGMEKFDATALGVYMHGLAGDYVREKKNAYSLMASDIVEALSYILDDR